MAYHTKQQEAILHCLEARGDTPVTAADLAADLRAAGHPVGLATIYRQLEKLAETGSIHQAQTKEGTVYQYCGHAQCGQCCCLLRCQGCGRIVHMDCAKLGEFYRHMEQEHHVRIDPRKTMLTGWCDDCAAKEEKHGKQGTT